MPLLKWYIEHGLKVLAVYRTIDYVPRRVFYWFVHEVANMRRKGDAEADKALFAEIYNLLGNSAYGKFIEAVERQPKVLYTKDEDEVDKHMRSAYFEDLEEIGDAYKIELRKDEVKINRPFQVGIVVYHRLAKRRMLEFYYDFLDKYIDRRDFELIQMDTDSFYFALSHDTLEDAVKPELLEEFEREKNQWLSWDNLRRKAQGPVPSAASATLLTTKTAVRQRYLPRVYHKSRTCPRLNQVPSSSSNKSTTSKSGKGTIWLWMATRTWPQTEASG